MKRKQLYETPEAETFEIRMEENLLASGEKVTIVNGYSWDPEEDE